MNNATPHGVALFALYVFSVSTCQCPPTKCNKPTFNILMADTAYNCPYLPNVRPKAKSPPNYCFKKYADYKAHSLHDICKTIYRCSAVRLLLLRSNLAVGQG